MVPVQNIYYLLCYAWNKWQEQEIIQVSATESPTLPELLTKVLLNATRWQLKKGLYHKYSTENEHIKGIKGKIDLDTSIKYRLFSKGLSVCEYDEFSANNLPNQILKSTLTRLSRLEGLPATLRQEIRTVLPRLAGIDTITLQAAIYSKVVLHRENRFYDFMLNICKLMNEHLLIEEHEGQFVFQDFLRDERNMAVIFETFVRNFYRQHLHTPVSREQLHWQVSGTSDNLAFLPKMQTDVSIQLPDKKVIIDAKFYKETFQHYYDAEKIHSQHLFQLFAYLKNQPNKHCEGILLYPVVRKNVSLNFEHEGHKIRIETINLAQNWQQIETDMLSILSL